jgi:nucleotide-binding universal stress UspA family protein
VLHVSSTSGLTEVQQKNKTILEKVLEAADHRSHVVAHENVRSAINDFQLKENIDFLVMIQNKHTFMERLFLKSNIKQIGLEIKVPFMVIPCPSK